MGIAMFRSTAVRVALALVAVSGLAAARAAAQGLHTNLLTPGLLRICADPDNMPLSNQKGEGFEQKIAALIGKELNAKVEYAWWPVRRGYFSRALNGRYCDIAIEAPSGLDMAAVTKPYFRSGYMFLTRKDSGLDITSLADPRLKKLKIGVNLLHSDAENTPPAMALSRYGVVGNLTGYSTFYTDEDRPEDIVEGVANKEVDIAIVWGPLAGYYAARQNAPLAVTPIPSKPGDLPFAFDISMGVKKGNDALYARLERLLAARRPEILKILGDYHVPLVERPAAAQR
jgi:mxaJ protein